MISFPEFGHGNHVLASALASPASLI